ncbi:hypothetical protein [Streptomyces sp. NPDC049906]|uniref:hypothetical protein n=1 Tax=Streptomyces sp. NPDC049906 TaxID=3155656 RepID=UPI00343173D2
MAEECEYRALFAVDVERSAGRGGPAFLRVREALSAALRESFRRSGIDWDGCLCDDLGDGLRVTAPAGLPKARLIHPLVHELDARLRAHNELAGPLTRVRVRVALHAGEVHVSPDGRVTGRPLEVLARLLDSAPLRRALARAPEAATALVVSQHFHEETVCPGRPGIDPASFHATPVTEKEYTGSAWLHVPGHRDPAPAPAAARPARPAEGPRPAPDDRPGAGRVTMKNRASGNAVVNALQNGTQYVRVGGGGE